MAPPPEYDKEPKAPDKCSSSNTTEEPNYQTLNDQPLNPDAKSSTSANNVDTEDSKDVEALDDSQLRALLDEAITYKCPKDREGKSSLFKELLEGVEQDEQKCEAAARTRRGAGASNSLQDLVAALAAEPAAPRRHRPPRDHASVSARTHHGGSLPSGVDTSFLLGEEPPRVSGYVATVRCVNPSPLTERRVSTSDVHPPLDDPRDRRGMAAFPMTYTARATLEIGSGGAAGRAVTTTTASNQKQEHLKSLESAEDPNTEQSALDPRPNDLPNELAIRSDRSVHGADDAAGSRQVPLEITETKCQEVEMKDFKMSEPESPVATNDTHSVDRTNNKSYFASQQQLLKTLELVEDANNNTTDAERGANKMSTEGVCRSVTIDMEGIVKSDESISEQQAEDIIEEIIRKPDADISRLLGAEWGGGGAGARAAARAGGAGQLAALAARPRQEQFVLAELPNNALVFLTFPKPHALTSNPDNSNTRDRKPTLTKKLKEPSKETKSKKSLREMLLETLMKEGVASSGVEKPSVKVDSGIPFSCITTPEVVTNCNTTSSTQQSAVAVDPKPLQLGSAYSAVASLVGAPHPSLTLRHDKPRAAPAAAAAPPPADDTRKSIDENGNSVQGSSSPLSSQQKKPRRKKTTKNETVIKSHQIDGYQGNKDLNELLRFIESNDEHRKLPRAKHRDDNDDKGKKRRKDKERGKRASSLEERSRTTLASLTDPAPPAAAAERRSWGDDAFYYQPPPPPAQPAPAPAPAAPPAPATPVTPVTPVTPAREKKKSKPPTEPPTPVPAPLATAPEPPAETALELLDFQTVTKKKKQRRRTEESIGCGVRAASPGRRRTAPPSDKSNDSNDDLDSVHSAPDAADAAPDAAADAAPRGASYADIARTRHNIPDLIESCNYYADGESAPPAPAYDADSYPALAGRRGGSGGGGGGGAVRKPPPPVPALPPAPAPAAPPDVVVADRPPVILLDEAARPRDMDGITFGFDVNEQLLACGRRARCDLVAAAEQPAPPPPAPAAAAAPAPPLAPPAVRVRDNLRYRPPPPPPPGAPPPACLRPIVDYVGSAWEDIMKCGGGKVRYFAE